MDATPRHRDGEAHRPRDLRRHLCLGGLHDDPGLRRVAEAGGQCAAPPVLLPDDARQQNPAPRLDACVHQRLYGVDAAGQPRLHVRNAPPVEPAVPDRRLQRRRIPVVQLPGGHRVYVPTEH